MFGSSTWGQNNNQQQQQQQQQQQGGLFGGGGGGFGQQANTAGGFGQSTGGFGQPQQQQQGGGLFGSNTASNTGFGGFGATAQQPQQQTSSFGARPAFGATGTSSFGQSNTTSGGLFGSNNNNTTSTFGSNTGNTGGLFGNTASTSNSGFGSGATSNLFGARPANASPFGAGASTSNNQVQPYNPGPNFPPVPPTGTANPQYTPTWQQDPPATGSTATAPPHLFHVISAMEPYRGGSFEELRLMDYEQNRKDAGASAQQTGFGQPAATGFGQQPATTGFGQQPASTGFGMGAKPAGGLFGSQGSTTGGFGSTSTGGFGSTSTGTSGGLFGQTQPQTSTFGQQNNTTGGLFGQQNQQQQQQQQQPASGGLFGNTSNTFGAANTQQPAAPSSSFSFGAKPAATGFGTGSTGSTGFGSNTGTTGGLFGQSNTGSTGFGGFGQNNQQQQTQQPAATGGGLFGGSTGFGATNTAQPATSSLFGQQPAQQNQQQQPASGGLFGNTASKPLFGSTPTSTTAGSTSFGFGQNNNTTQPATGSLFGQTNTSTTQPASTGLFGQTAQQPAAQQPASGGLFGNNTSSLFGNKPAAPAATGSSLFGNTQSQPANTGSSLFGNTAQTGQTGQTSSLFGNTNTAQAQPAQSNSLFGGGSSLFNKPAQQPAQQTSSLFGNLNQSQPQQNSLFGSQQAQPQQTGLGSSLFSQPNNQAQQQPTLTASIDQNPYGNNQLFNYTGQKLDLGSSVKKPALPPLTSSSFRVTPNKSQLNKLRGFSTPLSSPRAGSPLNTLSTPNRIGSPSADRYKGLSDTALTPNAFVPRPSIKKLSVQPKTPVNGVNGGEDKLESVLGKSALRSTPTPASPAAATTDSPLRRSTTVDRSLPVAGSERQLKKGEYWCKPKLEKLKQLPASELRSIRDFVAGCKGKGEVAFLQPVDLTGLDLDDFLGNVIVFSDMECAVYPDDTNKPPRGQGLNVPARISLENCFPQEKGTKRPITDPTDPRHVRFMKRIKTIAETDFISYTEDGVWTFEVQHFSRYGIAQSDSEDEVEDKEQPPAKTLPEKVEKIVEAFSGSEYSDDDHALPPTRGLHEDESDLATGSELSDEGHDDLTELSDLTADSISPPPVFQPSIKLDLEGKRKIAEMQSSFFAQAPREKKRIAVPDFEVAEGKDVKLDERVVRRISFGEESPKVTRMPRKYVRAQVFEKGDEGVLADAGLALERSFRASFGPNGQLVRIGGGGKPEQVVIEPTEVIEAGRARLLELHLERTAVDLVDGVPTAALDSDIRFRDFARLFDSGDRSHEAIIWRLGVALFDEIDLGGVDIERVAEVRRKLALSKWFEDAVSPLVDQDLLQASGPEKIFTLLTGGQVERAVQASLDGSDMRLATLVSQIGGPEVFRQEVERQLDDWEKGKVPISPAYKRLYRLLAGDVDDSGLDWKRAFGLRLWFGNPFEDTISEVLASYTGNPLPPWGGDSIDVLYGLIKLYADVGIALEDVLRSRDCSSSPYDARLQWHLYMLLSRALRVRDFGDREEGYSALADSLTSSYAAQLEQSGDWTWAAFVLLHLETDARVQAIKSLLQRHPHPSHPEREFLSRLAIPNEWIHEAIAFDSEPYKAYSQLILAGRYDDAQRILLDKLAVEAIIRDDRKLLFRLCSMLEGKPSNWEYGGGVIMDYLQGRARPQLLPGLFPSSPQSSAALADMLSALITPPVSGPISSDLVVSDRLLLLQETAVGQLGKDIAGLAAAA